MTCLGSCTLSMKNFLLVFFFKRKPAINKLSQFLSILECLYFVFTFEIVFLDIIVLGWEFSFILYVIPVPSGLHFLLMRHQLLISVEYPCMWWGFFSCFFKIFFQSLFLNIFNIICPGVNLSVNPTWILYVMSYFFVSLKCSFSLCLSTF